MIEGIQHKLEELYRLPLFPEVKQYLLSPSQFHSFTKIKTDRPQVIYMDEDQDASVGIYLGKKVFKSITRNHRIFSFQDFCVVAEEVSHFVYLLWSKCNGKQINLLDLEIQAEIDKYLLATQVFPHDKTILSRLFEQFSIRGELNDEEKQRYLLANRFGRKIAHEWEHKKTPRSKKINWLRFFYRQGPNARISMIERGLQ